MTLHPLPSQVDFSGQSSAPGLLRAEAGETDQKKSKMETACYEVNISELCFFWGGM